MTKEKVSLQTQFVREMERQEAAYLSDYYRGLPGELADSYGASYCEFGGGGAAITAKMDLLAFNRVVGLGLEAPVAEALIEEIIRVYRSAGASRFFIQLSRIGERAGVIPLLDAKGFHHYNNWVKLYRPVRPVPQVETDLQIEEIGVRQKDAFAEILVKSFGWPEALKPLLSHPVGRPGWKHYLAFEDLKPVASAALFIRGGYASMAFAATLPDYRGRGAQSALIARRLHDAADAGCRWALVETAEEKADKPVASFRNMRRFGFEVAYLRPNYLLKFGK